MSDIAELTLKTLKKYRTIMIGMAIVSGLDIKEFIAPLWTTGKVGAAWSNWLAHGLPDVPAYFAILAACFAVVIAWEVGEQSQEDGYTARTDGYRSGRDDD